MKIKVDQTIFVREIILLHVCLGNTILHLGNHKYFNFQIRNKACPKIQKAISISWIIPLNDQ